jgi:hypothetical protein
MRQVLLLPVVSLLVITLAAKAGHQVTGSGPVVRKALAVPAFHGIHVEGSMDVVVTPANGQQVQVEAQENLVDLVTTEVRNGIWTISVREGYRTSQPFVVHISAPLLDEVSSMGSGDVKGLGPFTAERVRLSVQGSGDLDMAFTATAVDVVVQGSGDVALAGTCSELSATVQGSGDIDAKDLKAEHARATSSGSGDITVFATKRLKAVVAGSGDVVYGGGPQHVEKQVAGSGDVRALRTSGKL